MLKPDSRGMTVLLAFMTAMGPISTDLYVPALPQLVTELATTPARVQWTMSAYLIGFALGQLFYGPLSDKYGRKPLLMIGFAAYLIGTALSAFAASIEWLTAARLLQGVGGAGPIIMARAIVRDMYEGARAGRQLSIMSTIMGVAPIVSPVLGGFLVVWFGWRASFVAMLAMIGPIAFMASLYLPETLRHVQSGPISVRAIGQSYAVVASNRVWRVYASIMAMSHTGLFTFVAASPFVLQTIYGLTPVEFGAGFSVCSIAFVSGAYFGSRLVTRIGIDGVVSLGVLCLAGGGALQLLGYLIFPQSVLALFIPELIYFYGIGYVLPHSIAGALSPMPERAGAATSLQGFLQMSFSAAMGIFVVALIPLYGPLPLAVTTCVMGLGTLIVFRLSQKTRAAGRAATRRF